MSIVYHSATYNRKEKEAVLARRLFVAPTAAGLQSRIKDIA